MPLTQAWWKPRAFTQAASLEQISKSCLRHKARSEESDSRTTLLLPSCFLLHQMRAGSLAKHWSSPAVIANQNRSGEGREGLPGRPPFAARPAVAPYQVVCVLLLRYGSHEAYQPVLTRKREHQPTLRWHRKIPHTRISRNGIVIEC